MAHKHDINCLDERLNSLYCKVTGKPMKTRSSGPSLRERVLAKVSESGGTTNSVIIASQLGLKYKTVQRVADKLRDEGKIMRDENDAWVLSDEAYRERDEERQYKEGLAKLLRR
jgi:DNA-binding transcriptional regulator YhcF (GntR family)